MRLTLFTPSAWPSLRSIARWRAQRPFPSMMIATCPGSVRETENCTGLNLLLCLSYSSRWELTQAARRIATQVKNGEISVDDICEQTICDTLSTASIPDPDLLIRTGGEQRISNFLLWQIAYSELYFTDILWPDFDNNAYLDALIDYQGRERRFGKTSDQVKSSI